MHSKYFTTCERITWSTVSKTTQFLYQSTPGSLMTEDDSPLADEYHDNVCSTCAEMTKVQAIYVCGRCPVNNARLCHSFELHILLVYPIN